MGPKVKPQPSTILKNFKCKHEHKKLWVSAKHDTRSIIYNPQFIFKQNKNKHQLSLVSFKWNGVNKNNTKKTNLTRFDEDSTWKGTAAIWQRTVTARVKFRLRHRQTALKLMTVLWVNQWVDAFAKQIRLHTSTANFQYIMKTRSPQQASWECLHPDTC